MSYEYAGPAQWAREPREVDRFVDAFLQATTWKLVGRDAKTVRLALPERTTPDEDARIVFREDDIYVAVHTGTRAQRDELLRNLESAAAVVGAQLQLAEL
jgi:hypothetical protein